MKDELLNEHRQKEPIPDHSELVGAVKSKLGLENIPLLKDHISPTQYEEWMQHNETLSETPFKEVLHYYIGSKFKFEHKKTSFIGIIETYNQWGFLFGDKVPKKDDHDYYEIEVWEDLKYFKLLLKASCDMTVGELREYQKKCYMNYDTSGRLYRISDTPESLHWLFKNHWDAFDLIPRGFAIRVKPSEMKNIYP